MLCKSQHKTCASRRHKPRFTYDPLVCRLFSCRCVQLCRSLKRERDQLQHHVGAQEQASPAPQPKPDGSARQLQDVQAQLASTQAQLQVRRPSLTPSIATPPQPHPCSLAGPVWSAQQLQDVQAGSGLGTIANKTA